VIDDAARTLLGNALAGRLEGWAGLPHGCTADDLAALGAAPGPLVPGRLAGLAMPLRDHAGPLRVFYGDNGQAVLLRDDRPRPAATCAALQAALGAPEAVLDGRRRPGTRQLVWARHGAAAWVGDDGLLYGLSLFAPCSAETYRTTLGGEDGPPWRPR
jgi:hypothetical protein